PLTLPSDFLKKHHKELWLSGLAFRFDPAGEIDNLILLDSNWRRSFRKDKIKNGSAINKNYVLPLAMLNDYYEQTGQDNLRNEVRSYLSVIAPQTGKPSRVKTISAY
ncbi:MAG: hypothetical protein HKN32_10625, partial [Flavobacteriales bacterium]|nr:hypothetical protein [Flavobacteriales bacterium]